MEDHEVLTKITKQSKAYWQYSKELMLHWNDELTITPIYIQHNKVFKLVTGNEPIGYYSYVEVAENTIRLDNLFLLPEYIGQGLGRVLMNDFLDHIKKNKIEKVLLESDPNAEKFYTRFGFIKIAHKETKIKGRFLPIMEMKNKE